MDSFKLTNYLRGWMGVVALMSFGSTVACFKNMKSLQERFYTSKLSDGKKEEKTISYLFFLHYRYITYYFTLQ